MVKKTSDESTEGVRSLDNMQLESDDVTLEEHEASFHPGVYNLSAKELVFPLRVEDNGQERVLLAKMSPYTHKEGIELFEAMGLKFKFSGREKLTTRSGMNEKVRPFFWKHFLNMGGLSKLVWKETGLDLNDAEYDKYAYGELTEEDVQIVDANKEDQIKFIKENPAKRIEEATVLQGFGNFNIDVMTATQSDTLIIGGRSLNIINGHVFVYDQETKTNKKIKVKVGFKKDSESNFRRYLTATGQSEMHRKSEEWQKIEDYRTILDIGKTEILFAEGFEINGKPCQADNKREWVDSFPFWYLQAMVDEIYGRGASVKNG